MNAQAAKKEPSSDDRSMETRAIYHKQHSRVANDQTAMTRFISMFSTEYFGVEKNFFKGKKCLDAGCGSTAKLLIALHKLGATDLSGFDLGEDYMEVAQGTLTAYGVPEGSVQLQPGNILTPPHEPESFDFVACHGVMLHLNTMEEAEQAFKNLAALVKPGGYFYTVYGNVGGLLEEAIFPAIRQYYRNHPEFKTLIDNLQPSDFHRLVDMISEGIFGYEGEKLDLERLKPMFDEDLCVTIQNVLQVPVRLPIDEAMVRSLYTANSFEDPRRLKRYVKRKNIRRFFAPLHYNVEDTVVQMIYGSGNLGFIAQKQ